MPGLGDPVDSRLECYWSRGQSPASLRLPDFDPIRDSKAPSPVSRPAMRTITDPGRKSPTRPLDRAGNTPLDKTVTLKSGHAFRGLSETRIFLVVFVTVNSET